jgi:hypothetical protein
MMKLLVKLLIRSIIVIGKIVLWAGTKAKKRAKLKGDVELGQMIEFDYSLKELDNTINYLKSLL